VSVLSVTFSLQNMNVSGYIYMCMNISTLTYVIKLVESLFSLKVQV
jgi:hypothetical protein